MSLLCETIKSALQTGPQTSHIHRMILHKHVLSSSPALLQLMVLVTLKRAEHSGREQGKGAGIQRCGGGGVGADPRRIDQSSVPDYIDFHVI